MTLSTDFVNFILTIFKLCICPEKSGLKAVDKPLNYKKWVSSVTCSAGFALCKGLYQARYENSYHLYRRNQ